MDTARVSGPSGAAVSSTAQLECGQRTTAAASGHRLPGAGHERHRVFAASCPRDLKTSLYGSAPVWRPAVLCVRRVGNKGGGWASDAPKRIAGPACGARPVVTWRVRTRSPKTQVLRSLVRSFHPCHGIRDTRAALIEGRGIFLLCLHAHENSISLPSAAWWLHSSFGFL